MDLDQIEPAVQRAQFQKVRLGIFPISDAKLA